MPTFPFDTLKKCVSRVRLWPCRARNRLAVGCAHGQAPTALLSQPPTRPNFNPLRRLQASDDPRTVLAEARVLLREGGPLRFYRGFTLKCGFVALNGAIFNTVFVAVRKALKVMDGS